MRQFLQLRLASLQQTYCPRGFTPLHIAAMHGYHSAAELLVTKYADVNARDCNGSTPLHVASCHGMITLVTLLVDNGAKINRRSFNFSTPLHSAATCFATSSFCTLLEKGGDFLAKDDKNMTALHYLVKNIKVVGREYFADLYVEKPVNWIEDALNEKEPWEKGELQYSWLNALVRITNSFANSIDATHFKNMSNSIIKTYSIVFHLLQQKANASLLLTGSAESFGSSHLVSIATPPAFIYDIIFHKVLKSRVLTINKPYRPTLIPGPLKNALSRTFTVFYPGVRNCSRLTLMVAGNLVFSVNVLLQAGADVNCQDQSWSSPLLTYLHNGGRHMSKVLTKHKVTVEISCGEPFERSTLHLISYHKLHYLHYISQYVLGEKMFSEYIFDYFFDNYEEVQEHNGSSKAFRIGDGPLAVAIKSHPRGTKVIDECFDAEGFNALHRAAQGANVIAVMKFLAWGANPYLENADGFSPLWLSVLYSVKYMPFLNFHKENILTELEVDFASTSAVLILERLLQNGTVNIGCNESRADLTLYHIAAIRGMWAFIHHLLSEKRVRVTGLDVNCPNKDGITPMYLAVLVGGVACDWQSPWCKVVQVIKTFGGTLRYPTLEAEYFLLFHLFFGMSAGYKFLDVAKEETLSFQDDCRRYECEDYRSGDDSLFRASSKLSKVYHRYREKVDSQDLPYFLSVMDIFYQHKLLKLQHGIIRHDFLWLLEEESSHIQSLLLVVTKPYSRKLKSNDESNNRKPTNRTRKESQQQRKTTSNYNEESQGEQSKTTAASPDDMGSNSVSLETALHVSYLKFKDSFDRLQKYSQHAKSVILAKRNRSRVLSRVNQALHKITIQLYAVIGKQLQPGMRC